MITVPGSFPDYYYPTEFRIGRALSRGFEVLFGNLVPFLAISAIAALPASVYEFAVANGYQPGRGGTWIELLVQIVFNTLCEAMILYATFQALRGRRVRADASIARGLLRFGPVLGTSLLVILLVTLSAVLLIMPGLITFTILSVALPVCVIERLGPVGSIERSSTLTRGYRWPIFGGLGAIIIVNVVVGELLGVTRGTGATWLYPTVLFGWDMLAEAYQTVVVAIIYHDLRIVKDGIDLENIAAVFD